MALLSPLKSRRLRTHKGETTQQVIVFQLRHEWFALPIFAVKKVVTKSETQGDYQHMGAGLTVHEGKELLVLDIGYQIFGNIGNPMYSPASQPVASSVDQPTHQYLLIMRNRQGDLAGLPLLSSPTVKRFSESAIVPLPANYASRVNIQCVSGLIVQSDSQPILFLLNPDQLLHSQPLLPPMS
ncbi:chemotaxis protein CheW [Leptothoe sp. PORK10 BA2]|uniref:chemotaxis protein CheW n=1 Tax=Leptothoe sp. PORK10 BA2 TaxID=3110254 RepID=UPI002B21A131|nr:chemotaxis protein CheW [Leptothoe sp. PORK10 BA2]MEA5464344.1 chemotaxis protein CheW [Leptothoe sp. PORK10 BA2]